MANTPAIPSISWRPLISPRRVEHLRETCQKLKGVGLIVATIEQSCTERDRNELYAWYFETMGINCWFDYTARHLFSGYAYSPNIQGLVRQTFKANPLETVSPNYSHISQTERDTINEWFSEFQSDFAPLSKAVNHEMKPRGKNGSIWWESFLPHLAKWIPSLDVVTRIKCPLPVGTYNERIEAEFGRGGRVAALGCMWAVEDLAKENEKFLDHVLDWIEIDCPIPVNSALANKPTATDIMAAYANATGSTAERRAAVADLVKRSNYKSFETAKAAASKKGITLKSLKRRRGRKVSK